MSDIQYVYPLILNKVTPPHYVTPTLRRSRLLEWLDSTSTCRAVVIAADAGYGKTTLLWQWEREVDFPVYWYKLDRNDRDWTLHISYLIEAVSQRHPGFGLRAHSMLQQLGGPGSSRPGVAAFLMAEMHERLTEPCTFIIDDWQFVASVTEVRGLWNQILRDAPPTCRFIFLSRAKPQLQFARFTTHGGYAEIRTDALRFTDREIDELFRDIYQDPLTPTELAELDRRTEGWAASLQLVEVSLRERRTPEERRAFIQSITATTDSDLFAFLAEEVLDQQGEQVRNFLLSTSILQQMDAELAERLAGIHDGAQLLADLEQRGLFTYRLDADRARYRYHGLFRDFLERRLILERTDGEVTGLHIHAASYYETHEQWPQAIHHYLRAGLTPQAARLIARYGEDVVSEGRLGLVDEWLRQLPAKTIRDNARLSLLWGEASGIRGDWEGALAALQRARTFFARKGDRRMEALACLKISTVYNNLGDVARCAEIAQEGMTLAPEDAHATRLRLRGNIAVTSTWLESVEEAERECERVAREFAARGLEHFVAIARHNLGLIQRYGGRLVESLENLSGAAKFWDASPSSPFADNAEYVQTLLALGDVDRADSVATAAIARTEPWPRPNAEARYGLALTRVQQGRFAEAIRILDGVISQPDHLGSVAGGALALSIEAAFLAVGHRRRMADLLRALADATPDPRVAPTTCVAAAVASHEVGRCDGQCAGAYQTLATWEGNGAAFLALTGRAKLGVLQIEHHGGRAAMRAANDIGAAIRRGYAHHLQWWLRRCGRSLDLLVQLADGPELLAALVDADPQFWVPAAAGHLPTIQVPRRQALVAAIIRQSDRDTGAHLAGMVGADIAEARRSIAQRHALKVYVRTFGTMTLHRGSWDGPAILVTRRRMRVLLGLLAANIHTGLSREMVLDRLWPDADPASAVNSLNQTVFQLRRMLTPDYREGESPQYVVSSLETVHLNPDLVVTDAGEALRLARVLRGDLPATAKGLAAHALIDLMRGEFLADVRYEDWASPLQLTMYTQLRDTLLPIAMGRVAGMSDDVALRAGCGLALLDPLDEGAQIAIAMRLATTGRRAAARDLVTRFIQKLKTELAEEPSDELVAVAALVGAAT